MKIMAVTGTKGKTTIVRLADYVLYNLGYKTLSVDSETVNVNGTKIFDDSYSKSVYGIIPSKCPGRFLYLGYDRKKNNRDIDFATMEAVIGCRSAGLGYQKHQVGIFTNIYEDHIGSGGIRNRKDLTTRKWEVISNIEDGGLIVYNQDDILIKNIVEKKGTMDILPVTIDKSKYIRNKDGILLREDKIEIKFHKKTFIYYTKKSEFSFYGKYFPSLINIGFVLGGLIGLLGIDIFSKKFKEISNILDNYKSDIYGGRMYFIHYKNRKIILDYAHEKKSLEEVLQLAQKIKTNKSIAVVRLAPDRQNNIYKETGKHIAKFADHFIVYDKIDGIDRKNYISPTGTFKRKPGEVMDIFSTSIKKNNPNTEKIIYWKDAIKKAIKISKEGDIITIIVNDPKKTGAFVKKLLHL